MTLSILIPTLPERKEMLSHLLSTLHIKYLPEVEILTDDDTKLSTGAKRNRLLQRASGEYVVFIDDDDEVSDIYIAAILVAIKKKPDVIGFSGWMTTNGGKRSEFKISVNNPYTTIKEKGTLTYLRFNNHLSPIKRDIALKIGYRDISREEDYDYAVRLKTSGFIQFEVYINRPLYHYKFIHPK